jgi:hypothetical protein
LRGKDGEEGVRQNLRKYDEVGRGGGYGGQRKHLLDYTDRGGSVEVDVVHLLKAASETRRGAQKGLGRYVE